MTTTQPAFLALTLDTECITQGLRKMTTAISELAAQTAHLLDRVHTRMNSPVVVAGMEGKYLARAALSPVYDDPEGRDWLVQRIMAGTYPDTALLSRENRALVAVSAIRGWVTTHG